MALSTKKKNTLNKLIDYIGALRKGQLSLKEGGDVRLGDLVGNYRVVVYGSVSVNVSPKTVSNSLIKTGDFAVAVIDSDESGMGAVPQVCMGAACTAGTLTITSGAIPAGATKAVAKYLVLRAQS